PRRGRLEPQHAERLDLGRGNRMESTGRRGRVRGLVPLLAVALVAGTSAAAGAVTSGKAASADPGCLLSQPGSATKHVIYLQFDNVHLTRDNPNVPSDLEQMPN